MPNPQHADGLEARLYEFLNSVGPDDPEPTGDQICKALKTTRDVLRPIVKRRNAIGSIGTHGGKGSEQTYFLRHNNWQPDDKADESETPTQAPKTKAIKTRGGRPKKVSRLAPLGPYAPVPRAILIDPSVSLHARGLAATLATKINLGPWNVDLHIDASYPALIEMTGASKSTLQRLVRELVATGYLETKNLQRGGVRFRFIGSPVTTT